MASQLKVVFFVPTKREWLWINGKTENYEEGALVDFTDTERNLKLLKTSIEGTKVMESFFGFSYENARANEKKIRLKYVLENEICETDHDIRVIRKTRPASVEYQVQLSNAQVPPLWKSKSQGGLVPGVEADDLLNPEDIEHANYDDPEVANGLYWPKKFVLWFGKCEQTGDFWHGVLNDDNIENYDDGHRIKRIYESMCDSRGASKRTGPTDVAKAILKYKGEASGEKVVIECDGVILKTKMSAGTLNQIKNGETNILLYGPPGTGKTFALNEFRSYLTSNLEANIITIDETNTRAPLQAASKIFEPSELNMPGKIKVWWTTFHQGVTYEDFVVGLRPRPEEGGITLEPRAGILLEAMEHARGDPDGGGKSTPNTSVIIIDELNRGNVEAILGDFITAMDKDYRAPYKDEKLDYNSPMSIPMIFNNINGTTEEHELGGKAKKSEDVRFASSGETKPIPLFSGGYKVPQTVIIVGTMNSVDRSIKPLDNALERRFVKVRCDPEYGVIRGTAARFGQKLLWISNDCIIQEFPDDGMDKTIGHSLMMKRETGLNTIQECYEEWRKHVVPVLIKRFKGRHQQLTDRLSKNFPLLAEASKKHLPDQDRFSFKKVLKDCSRGNKSSERDFVNEMFVPKVGKEVVANLIENGVFEDTLFKNGEEEKEFSITVDGVEWQQTSEEDGTETETTEVPEEEWNDWESVFTGKTLRQVVESNQSVEEPEEDDLEDINGHLDAHIERPLAGEERAEALIDLHLLVAHNTIHGFRANNQSRSRFTEYLTEEEKQNYEAANSAEAQKEILAGARAARTQKWIEKMGGAFIKDNKWDRRRVIKYFKENGVVLEDDT